MPRLHDWRNFKLTLLRGRSDGDGFGSVQANGEYEALDKSLLRYLKHGNSVVATDKVQTAIGSAAAADNAEVKSP
jgi:hypothetical protein